MIDDDDVGRFLFVSGCGLGLLTLLYWALRGRVRRGQSPPAAKVSAEQVALERQAQAESPTSNAVDEKRSEEAGPYRSACEDFGIVVETGEELRMGWYEHTFKLSRPVAGVDSVWTLNGDALFTVGNRCVVISDGQRLIILDREQDHGAQLEVPSRNFWFETFVAGSTVHVRYYEGHGHQARLTYSFAIEAHTRNKASLVPDDWPGKSKLMASNG